WGRGAFGEAGPAEADARLEELWPDAIVEADALGDLGDVRPGDLAHVADLVDEGDLRGREPVGRELAPLGAGDVRADELARALAAVLGLEQRPVELDDGL